MTISVKFSMTFPNLETELELVRSHGSVICVDEVGRGAIAGPVVVAATFFDNESSLVFPVGLKDSKLIAEPKREAMSMAASQWLPHGVGEVSAAEVDNNGISKSLEKAATLAIEAIGKSPGKILLDGSHNWLGFPKLVQTKLKADQQCAAVSAASIIAKHYRDEIMRSLHESHPSYDWKSNKGYASEAHIQAILTHGPTDVHRKSWLTRILNSEQTLF